MSDRAPDASVPLDLEGFARVTVALEIAREPREGVLAAHRLSARTWEAVRGYWSRCLAEDAAVDGPLVDAYAAALERAREEQIPLPPMSPEEWAALTLDVAERGADRALAARGLLPADYFRLASHWAKTLATDSALAARHARALYTAART